MPPLNRVLLTLALVATSMICVEALFPAPPRDACDGEKESTWIEERIPALISLGRAPNDQKFWACLYALVERHPEESLSATRRLHGVYGGDRVVSLLHARALLLTGRATDAHGVMSRARHVSGTHPLGAWVLARSSLAAVDSASPSRGAMQSLTSFSSAFVMSRNCRHDTDFAFLGSGGEWCDPARMAFEAADVEWKVMERPRQAAAWLQKAVTDHNAGSSVSMGTILARLAAVRLAHEAPDIDTAREEVTRALREEPGHAEAATVLARIHAMAGDIAGAQRVTARLFGAQEGDWIDGQVGTGAPSDWPKLTTDLVSTLVPASLPRGDPSRSRFLSDALQVASLSGDFRLRQQLETESLSVSLRHVKDMCDWNARNADELSRASDGISAGSDALAGLMRVSDMGRRVGLPEDKRCRIPAAVPVSTGPTLSQLSRAGGSDILLNTVQRNQCRVQRASAVSSRGPDAFGRYSLGLSEASELRVGFLGWDDTRPGDTWEFASLITAMDRSRAHVFYFAMSQVTANANGLGAKNAVRSGGDGGAVGVYDGYGVGVTARDSTGALYEAVPMGYTVDYRLTRFLEDNVARPFHTDSWRTTSRALAGSAWSDKLHVLVDLTSGGLADSVGGRATRTLSMRPAPIQVDFGHEIGDTPGNGSVQACDAIDYTIFRRRSSPGSKSGLYKTIDSSNVGNGAARGAIRLTRRIPYTRRHIDDTLESEMAASWSGLIDAEKTETIDGAEKKYVNYVATDAPSSVPLATLRAWCLVLRRAPTARLFLTHPLTQTARAGVADALVNSCAGDVKEDETHPNVSVDDDDDIGTRIVFVADVARHVAESSSFSGSNGGVTTTVAADGDWRPHRDAAAIARATIAMYADVYLSVPGGNHAMVAEAMYHAVPVVAARPGGLGAYMSRCADDVATAVADANAMGDEINVGDLVADVEPGDHGGYADIAVALSESEKHRRLLGSALRNAIGDPDGPRAESSTDEITHLLLALWETWTATRHHGKITGQTPRDRGIFDLVWGMGKKPHARVINPTKTQQNL